MRKKKRPGVVGRENSSRASGDVKYLRVTVARREHRLAACVRGCLCVCVRVRVRTYLCVCRDACLFREFALDESDEKNHED